LDHEAVQYFEEHDAAIPIAVLEELDRFADGKNQTPF
jgi:predicted ribonuclease YlaK